MRGSQRRKRKRGLYHAGEKGNNRVRVYPHSRNGTLMLEYFGNDGQRRSVSLHHTDVDRGKVAADDLAASLRRGEEPSGDLTLRIRRRPSRSTIAGRAPCLNAAGVRVRRSPIWTRRTGTSLCVRDEAACSRPAGKGRAFGIG
jgi:hypothetical protein